MLLNEHIFNCHNDRARASTTPKQLFSSSYLLRLLLTPWNDGFSLEILANIPYTIHLTFYRAHIRLNPNHFRIISIHIQWKERWKRLRGLSLSQFLGNDQNIEMCVCARIFFLNPFSSRTRFCLLPPFHLCVHTCLDLKILEDRRNQNDREKERERNELDHDKENIHILYFDDWRFGKAAAEWKYSNWGASYSKQREKNSNPIIESWYETTHLKPSSRRPRLVLCRGVNRNV